MVFRKENKVDAFQRQVSALRQQLGGVEESDNVPEDETGANDYAAGPTTAAGGSNADLGVYDSDDGYGFGGFSVAESGGRTDEDALDVAPDSIPTIPSYAVGDGQTSVIAHDTVWKGEIQTNGTLHVHGRVEGAIQAQQDIYVAEEADIEATLTAANVIIAGLVRGTIRCGTRFEVLPQGRVAGDIQSPTMVIHDGATVTGQFRMGAGEQADTQPATVMQRRVGQGQGR